MTCNSRDFLFLKVQALSLMIKGRCKLLGEQGDIFCMTLCSLYCIQHSFPIGADKCCILSLAM